MKSMSPADSPIPKALDPANSPIAAALANVPHPHLSALHRAVSDELSSRAEQAAKNKPVDKMSDQEFTKFAHEQIAQAAAKSPPGRLPKSPTLSELFKSRRPE